MEYLRDLVQHHSSYAEILYTLIATAASNLQFSVMGCSRVGELHVHATSYPCNAFKIALLWLIGRGVNREGFNFKLAVVKTCSTWPLLNKYAL